MNRFLIVLPTLCFAFFVLVYSLYSASAIQYQFDLPVLSQVAPTPLPHQLPPPPRVLPDNPLWLAKVIGERTQMLTTFDRINRANLLLNISNERLVSARVLFEQGNADDGMATLAKAESYLQLAAEEEKLARAEGLATVGLLQTLLQTSSMHKDVINSLLSLCPEDACPLIVQTADAPTRLFEEIKITLTSEGNEILSEIRI